MREIETYLLEDAMAKEGYRRICQAAQSGVDGVLTAVKVKEVSRQWALLQQVLLSCDAHVLPDSSTACDSDRTSQLHSLPCARVSWARAP